MDETQNPTPMNPNPMPEPPETPSTNGDGDGGQPMDGGAQMPPTSTPPMDGENNEGGTSE